MTSVLEVRGATVRYGGVTAVDGVDLDIDAGSVHGIIGMNGAGKTSFMDALSGRVKMASGTVNYQGVDITRRPVVWRRRAGIARSFQTTSVFPAMTIRNQFELVARKNGEPDLDDLVLALGLGELLDYPCGMVSYGDQRAVDIGLALIGHPKVVLLDEPGAGLSAAEALRMFDHVLRLARDRNVATVLVEHDVDAVFRVCDRVTVLHLGEVLASGCPDEVQSDEAVIGAYLGRAE